MIYNTVYGGVFHAYNISTLHPLPEYMLAPTIILKSHHIQPLHPALGKLCSVDVSKHI